MSAVAAVNDIIPSTVINAHFNKKPHFHYLLDKK